MELYTLFIIKPHKEFVRLRLANFGLNQCVEVTFRDKQLVFKVRDQSTIDDFYIGIDQGWIEFVLESSNSFLIDEGGIMDEFFLNLN